jgi:GAF domain-containing protein
MAVHDLEDLTLLNHRLPAVPRGVVAFPQRVNRRRRQLLRGLQSAIDWTWTGTASEPAQQVLSNTLRSACEVIGADAGFTLQTRDDAVLEVACAHQMAPPQLLDALLGRAAGALHRALVCGDLGLADSSGAVLPTAETEQRAPTVVALPLELGRNERGTLCMIRSGAPRHLSELDLEILGALAGQAALALRASNQQSALRRLAASLDALTPEPA